jgi:hypothetical protein
VKALRREYTEKYFEDIKPIKIKDNTCCGATEIKRIYNNLQWHMKISEGDSRQSYLSINTDTELVQYQTRDELNNLRVTEL